jgi:cytochrome c oxidase subunit 2
MPLVSHGLLRKLSRPTVAGVVLALGVALAGCAPTPVTHEAREVKSLYDLFMLAAIGVFVIVAGLITWSIVRYRQGAHAEPARFHTNLPAAVVWWSLPTLLVIGLFFVSAQVLAVVDKSPPASPLTVKVDSAQWTWRFTYPNGAQVRTLPGQQSPDVMLPIDTPIHFVLTSSDVIHSFYVPQFLIKRDNIPGITNEITLTIDREGVYNGQCAEFCGLLHADMRFTIHAVSPDAFAAWLQQQPAQAAQQASPAASSQ